MILGIASGPLAWEDSVLLTKHLLISMQGRLFCPMWWLLRPDFITIRNNLYCWLFLWPLLQQLSRSLLIFFAASKEQSECRKSKGKTKKKKKEKKKDKKGQRQSKIIKGKGKAWLKVCCSKEKADCDGKIENRKFSIKFE